MVHSKRIMDDCTKNAKEQYVLLPKIVHVDAEFNYMIYHPLPGEIVYERGRKQAIMVDLINGILHQYVRPYSQSNYEWGEVQHANQMSDFRLTQSLMGIALHPLMNCSDDFTWSYHALSNRYLITRCGLWHYTNIYELRYILTPRSRMLQFTQKYYES